MLFFLAAPLRCKKNRWPTVLLLRLSTVCYHVQRTGLALMKAITFLTFVWAGFVVVGEFHGKTGSTVPIGNNLPKPVAPVGAPLPGRSFTTSSSAPTTSSLFDLSQSSSNVFTSTMALVKEKFSAISSGSSFSAPLSQKSSSRGELRIARGIVVGQDGPDLILNCSGWIVRSAHGFIYAGDGLGMDPIYANLVETHEQFQFGRLMTVSQGTLREGFSIYDRAMWSTSSYLSGPVLVKGYPGGAVSKGKGIKIVVAQDGTASWMGNSIPAYTASFTLSD